MKSPPGAFRTVSSRAGKSCGVRTNGRLECWGDPAFVSYPRPAGKFRDVSVGTLHGCAVRADNAQVVCWGNGYYGEDLPPAGGFRSVASGTDHTCGWRTNRTAVCWGRNQWGQGDLPAALKVSSLNAGGAQTCALDRNSRLLCRGSFAYNSLLFSPSGVAPSSAGDERASPQMVIVDDFVGDVIANFLGNLFVSWGDSTDGGAGSTLLFIGGLLGASSDKETMEKLQAIQSQLDELANTLATVDRKASVILSDLKTLQCDDKLGDLDIAVRNIREADHQYRGSGPLTDTGSYMERVRNELTKAQQAGYVATDLRPAMRQFVADWYSKVQEDMVRIDAVLMNANYKSGPLGTCLDKAFMAWQAQAGDRQFDDRRIWSGLYWVIQKTMVDQALGAQMLLDMNKFTAITALSDPAVEPATPVIPEGNGWKVDSLCADVKAHSAQAAGNRRWDQALQVCQHNEAVIRVLYRNLVQQVELAGAPYSDKDVMLSMGSDLLGKGTASDNLLWLRSYDRNLPRIRGLHTDWLMNPGFNDLSGHGDANIFYGEGDQDRLGTWRADGNAWSNIFDNADAAGYAADRITLMADTTAEMDASPLFDASVKGISFWMTNSTFHLIFNDVLNYSHVLKWPYPSVDSFRTNSPVMDGAKCFVGSKIKRVCSNEVLGSMSKLSYTNEDSVYTYYTLGWNPEYETYVESLADFRLIYRVDRGFNFSISTLNYGYIEQKAGFWPDENWSSLYRMPVLNVKYRDCTPSMIVTTGPNPPKRENSRQVSGSDGVARDLPTRCGTDLDYFIDKLIKRPEVPGLDQLVRKPVYPAGVN